MKVLLTHELEQVSGGMTTLDWYNLEAGGPEATGISLSESGWCYAANMMNVSGAAAGVFGGGVATGGLLTGPAEVGFGPIGGAIALAGGATMGAGYLIGQAAGCQP